MACDALILAGGFGTRLRGTLGDLPKPMAPVAGRPFLEWQLDYLRLQRFTRVVLAVGYRGDAIEGHFGTHWHGLEILYSREETPLGTGGAIRAGLAQVQTDRAFVLNGDTLAGVDFCAYGKAMDTHSNAIGMAVVPVAEVQRFGSVTIDPRTGEVLTVAEKSSAGPGFINAGIYCLARDVFDGFSSLAPFSFEDVVLRDRSIKRDLFAFRGDGTFIDIGVPEDFIRAQSMVPTFVTLRERPISC